MIFNDHSRLIGSHAYLSASKYHWSNYDLEKLESVYYSSLAQQRGVELHALAHMCIRLGQKLPRSRKTMSLYVNDAINLGMTPEQVLYYSDLAYGTADAIGFYEREKLLRIHDLKTGATRASMRQLEIYAVYFCLEYNYHPKHIGMELRIYQDDGVIVHEPDPDYITELMHRLVEYDAHITKLKAEGRL